MSDWQPIDTAPDDQKVLVTNNLEARDAHGRMSHVWLVDLVQTGSDGERTAFTEDLVRIHRLTHWHPLPMVNGEADHDG